VTKGEERLRPWQAHVSGTHARDFEVSGGRFLQVEEVPSEISAVAKVHDEPGAGEGRRLLIKTHQVRGSGIISVSADGVADRRRRAVVEVRE